MNFDKILTITGKPGLYELKSQTRTGFVVTALADGKPTTVNGIRNQVQLLAEIAIYTLKEELPLREVFQKISEKENGGKAGVDPKAETIALEEYFFEIVPDYDEDKVYPSHIKKVIQWYNILQEKGVSFEEKQKEEEAKSDKEAGESDEGKGKVKKEKKEEKNEKGKAKSEEKKTKSKKE